MRGLPFPSNAVSDRETSYEYGTPVNNVNDIPIDPALVGPPIDPALMVEGTNAINYYTQPEMQQPPQHIIQPERHNQVRQYSEGPQGDPFAPQPTLAYFSVEPDPPIPSTKPVKRKRKPRREEECGFCQGDDTKNKDGQPEAMVTCVECGRSGHPSCMELSDLGDVLRAYPWKCIECKNCEICHEKGDDERILFCDFCDRGWHMDCMRPPIEEPPTGKWHCPLCPPLYLEMQYAQPEHPPITPQIRESSVASSSRSTALPLKSSIRSKGKGKAKAVAASDESGTEEVGVEVEDTPKMTRLRGKPKPSRKSKLYEAQYIDEVPSPRQTKRVRVLESSPMAPIPRVRLRIPSHKAKGKEREEDDQHKGIFDDILTLDERDTMKTTINNMDKQRFERSRILAEQKFAPPALPPPPFPRISETSDLLSTPGPSRPLRSSTTLHQIPTMPATPIGLSTSPAPSTPGPFSKNDPSTLRIRTIRFGQFDIKTWYDAPFPEEYATVPDGRLWICEFCLKYMKSQFAVERHRLKCKARHPPGDEIYRDGAVSIFEVDGRKNKIYCQNLCLLSKMFLDHKSLFYDVEPFLFYVVTEMDDIGARFVGYFSKEKRSPKDYNVSCIMTLPVRQRQGWGNLLIDFSYLLSKKEQRAGSPEKPLSSLGALGYKNYWTLALMRYLETAPDKPRLEDISAATSMTIEDIFTTLSQQNMISAREVTPPPIKPIPGQSIKFPKGRKNGVARRHLQRMQTNDKEIESPTGPFVAPIHYDIYWDRNIVHEYLRNWEAKGYLKLKPEKLNWSPYILTRIREEERQKEEQGQGERGEDEGETIQEGSERTAAVDKEDSGKIIGDANDAIANEPAAPNIPPSQSPFRIFDDEIADEVITVTPIRDNLKSKSRLSPAQETAELGVGRTSKPSQAPERAPQKRVRGRFSRASPVPTPKRDGSLTEELRITRIGRKSNVSTKSSRAVDEDEALATKLALEEQMQGRKLRSRPSGLELKRTTSAPVTITKMPQPRKRKRADLSPSMEESPPPKAFSTPPALVNGNHANGKIHDMETNKLEVMLFNEGAVSLITPPSKVQEEQLSGVPEPTEKPKVVGDMDKEYEDVKSEDLGTPLTSITSRQSLPSEDTVFAEAVSPVNGKPHGAIVELSGPEMGERVTIEPSAGMEADADADADVDADADGDADGEYEEDAEGEPDVEVEMETEEGMNGNGNGLS